MNYREIAPVPALQPYIKFVWLLDGLDANTNAVPERIFPDGCIELIFNLKKPLARIDGTTLIQQPTSFVFGQITKAMHILATNTYSVIAVRFTSFGLSAFTQIPSHEFKGIEVGLENLWGAEGKELEDRVNTLATDDAIDAIQHFFLARLKKQTHSLSSISSIVGLMEAQGGNQTVKHWADYANLSERQFNRIFNNVIGISPKEYLKITRFNKVLNLFNESNTEKLITIANQCGYYDQAHFIKDFKEYTGITPTGYVADSKTFLPA